ncbi:TPM1 [Mytilus coruscus]|uniref:TPM1 n=1 Tax=Mytilus coruscus TaxID=42192 RepID=A0A6J8B1A9_MYTCO|nr:TPM1 [Mytilus coruscus]
MGESLSKKWGQDPAYHEATETLTRSNKNTQQFVNKILAESSTLEAKNKDLEKEIAKLKASIEPKKTPRAKLNRGPSAEEQLLDGCLNEQQNLVGKNETLKQENIKLRKEIKVLSDEKESALSRLSKLAGIQLTKGNTDITDLSDSNRPTKLSEKWSSLYTDEWSEAYDELSKIKPNDKFRIEKELCDIVKKCYITCVKIEKKQMVDIKKHTWDIACCLHHRPDQLVEATQTTMFNKMVKEEQVDKKAATMVLNHRNNGGDVARLFVIQKCMEELVDIVHERRKYDKKLLEYVKQETIRQFENYRKPGSKNHVIKFVERCTDLCWSMVIKAPSMVLVYDQPDGGPIDKNMFTVYTKQGPLIDFVVWPALILHTNGPILAKGAAQGKEYEPNRYKGTKKDSESTLTPTKTAKSVKVENEISRVNWEKIAL